MVPASEDKDQMNRGRWGKAFQVEGTASTKAQKRSLEGTGSSLEGRGLSSEYRGGRSSSLRSQPVPPPPVHLQWLLKTLPTYRSPGSRPSSPPSWASPGPICDSRSRQRSSCGCPCPCRLPPLDRWLPEGGKCF